MSAIHGLTQRVRRAVDRVMQPYVDAIVVRSEFPDPAGRTGSPDYPTTAVHATARPSTRAVPSDFFHNLLHELRTLELDRVPKGARYALSVGASGGWYFDWFEQHVGELDVHVGVEAFEPMPADLPEYVRWNATTADRFDGVADRSIDLIFAGQTSEHLWADELANFLLQSQRVVVPGGLVVLDSPNRLITEHLDWSHGGHTVELSSDEISELLELAGFEVLSIRGVWRCRFEDRVYQLEEGLDDPALLVQRIAGGPDHPNDSFVWWVVAQEVGPARVDELVARTRELFDQHWPTRVSRGLFAHSSSTAINFAAGGPQSFETLPFYLPAGRTTLRVTLGHGDLSALTNFRVELFTPGPHTFRALPPEAAHRDGDSLEWTVELDDLVFAVALRISCEAANSPVSLALPLEISHDR
jgi:SAM-dependent methyltransferase